MNKNLQSYIDYSWNQKSEIKNPYGFCLLPSDSINRSGVPGTDIFGNGVDYPNCVPALIKQIESLGPQNTKVVNELNSNFLNTQATAGTQSFEGFSSSKPGGPVDLQTPRTQPLENEYYIKLASNSLNVKPDTIFSIFFSDSNINHLRSKVVQNVKEIKGIEIKEPNMEDFFQYMVNIYQNYKINNGSICFVKLLKNTDIKSEISKLNTQIIQEYVSKMISQINMYIYYYNDASQLPEQHDLPRYASMKGSRELEYQYGF